LQRRSQFSGLWFLLNMAAQISNIYQFKITLKRSKPPIWRRILVPEDYTFWNLHVAIQQAMGWSSAEGNYHLHQFEKINPETSQKDLIGVEDKFSGYGDELINEKKVKIAKYYSLSNKKANYEYISVMVGSMKSCWKTFYRQLPILSIQNVLLVKELFIGH
jgi:hypothetical protein